MSSLHPGEQDMHYSDGSHRWLPPKYANQERWREKVRGHVQEHQDTMGGEVFVETGSRLRGHPKGW